MNRVVFILVVVFSLMFTVNVFAEENNETIELVTYYPAPYGEYYSLYTDYLDLNSSDYTESAPAITPAPIEGRLWYDSADHTYKFSDDGSTWKKIGSGGVQVVPSDPVSPQTGDMWLIDPTAS